MSANKIRLGEMLLNAGLINKNQLNIALSNQREWGGKLGSILVNMGFIKEEKLAQFLSHQLNIPSIDIGSIRINNETISLVPRDIAEKYMLIPVAHQKRKGSITVLIAMSDPLDLNAIDEIQFSTGVRVKAGIAPEGAIWRALQIYYYNDKSVSAKLEATNEPLKIDTSDIDEHLEIFRGRDTEKEAVENHVPGEMPVEDIALEVRVIRNLLIRKGAFTLAEFFEEEKKMKK